MTAETSGRSPQLNQVSAPVLARVVPRLRGFPLWSLRAPYEGHKTRRSCWCSVKAAAASSAWARADAILRPIASATGGGNALPTCRYAAVLRPGMSQPGGKPCSRAAWAPGRSEGR